MKKVTIVGIIIISFICIGCFLIKEEKSLSENQNENITLAIYEETNKVNSIPAKTSGYYFDREKSTCNNASIEWDSITWSPVVKMNNQEHAVRTKCELHFTTTYHEGILNGADPILKDELIPVTIEDNGTVKKADLNTEWYSYANKKWANAIIKQNSYDALSKKGLVHGATKQDGYVSFDGVDDYIELGYANYDFGNKITVAAKFSFDEPKNEFLSQLAITNIDTSGVELYYIAGKATFTIYGQNSNRYLTLSSTTELELNTKYNIVGTYDGNTMKIYINGKLDNEMSVVDTIKVSPCPYVLGANPNLDGLQEYSSVNIYQAAIYDRALTEDEIKENFSNEIKIKNNEGLLSYVDFTNKTYEDNEIIPEDSIESYFVWIPKYRYKLWDLGEYNSLTEIDINKVHEIPLIFGDYNTMDEEIGECKTPMESGESGACKVGDFMTHPAFLSIPSTGFWVGKFETGYVGATLPDLAFQNVNDSTKIIIKPNVYSWRGASISNAHLNSYNYKRNLDSHMMKNTEWGAVAYLSHSKYGNTNKIRLNNNIDRLTGYAAINEPTCGYNKTNLECNIQCNDLTCTNPYNTLGGYLSSTTGNISGVYDMSGGSWENMMSFMMNDKKELISGKNNLAHSGFNGTLSCPSCDGGDSTITKIISGTDFPDKKYYDTYLYSETTSNYQRRILGDATGELGPFEERMTIETRNLSSWYDNRAEFSFQNLPIIMRGGNLGDGTESGIMCFGNHTGTSHNSITFRIILTPTK